MNLSTDLSSVKTARLVVLYNEKAAATVKKFSDRETAIDRVRKLAELAELDIVVANGEAVWATPDVDTNSEAIDPFEDTGEKPKVEEPKTNGTTAPAGLAATLKPASDSPKKRGPVPQHEDDHVITVLSETNPKRKNSKSAERFALYKNGATVAEFLAACAALQGGQAEKYRADLLWDTDKGFISVSPAKTED